MTHATIMLYADTEDCDSAIGPATFATGLAQLLNAHLSILLPASNVLRPVWETRSADDIERDETSRLQKCIALAASLAANAREKAVSVSTQVEWAHAFGLTSFLGEQAMLHDLVVMGGGEGWNASERHIAEHLLFESGRPLLIVPADKAASPSCKRVAVAWDYSRGAARALHDALPLLRKADEVVLIAVGGEKTFQTNLEPEVIVAGLQRKGLNVRFEQQDLNRRSIGSAIQEFAEETGAELLVMGAYGHSRFRDFILGGATRQILDSPRIPVLLSH